MEGILKFNLPEENHDFKLAVNASSWYAVLWDIDQSLRNKIKYGNLGEDVENALQEVRDDIHSRMNDSNITFE